MRTITKLPWYLLAGLVFALSPITSSAQILDHGFYFILKDRPCLDNQVKLIFASGNVCLPDNPMIVVQEIEYVGEIREYKPQNTRKLILKLSAAGTKKLAALTEMYPGEKLALVLDKKVFSILTIMADAPSGEVHLTENLEGSTLRKTLVILQSVLNP